MLLFLMIILLGLRKVSINHILAIYAHCKGEASIPVGEAIDSHGQRTMRRLPCPFCDSAGKRPKWIDLQQFAQLLVRAFSPVGFTSPLARCLTTWALIQPATGAAIGAICVPKKSPRTINRCAAVCACCRHTSAPVATDRLQGLRGWRQTG